MLVRFHGTRGSLASPGPRTVRYGGHTSCIEVRSAAGALVMLDCGTGAHRLSQSLIASGAKPLRGHMLISHTHWDHIQGIPFFAPLFVQGNEWDVYAPRGLQESLRQTLSGQMQYTYFPVSLEELGATIRYHELVEGSFEIADLRIRTQYLNHTCLAMGYRLEQADGATLVYACDHEPHSRGLALGPEHVGPQDRRHMEFLADADLVIHDAQYTSEEYPRKVGWGHSTMDYAVRMAELARARQLALTHHDPLRDDDALDAIVAGVRGVLVDRGSALQVFAAAEGQELRLAGTARPRPRSDEPSAEANPGAALVARSALIAVADPVLASQLGGALRADDTQLFFARDGAEALRIAQTSQPSLVMVQHDLPGIGALELCRLIRGDGAYGAEVPVIVIADAEQADTGAAAGVTDWLIRPFTAQYARTRGRAWLIRAASRWRRAPIPPNEEQRLAALRQLNLLDTPCEERFDRLTRLACAVFDVPVALISLIDRDRQWFKSTCGSDERESPRDLSFCAHAVASGSAMVVPDTLLDDRFADNPVVAAGPRVRFYAGCPLILADGSCVGTLCLVDTRARELDEASLGLLADLAALAVQELTRDA